MYKIYDLKCDGMAAPLGISHACPEFSWKLESGRNGVYQTSFRILVYRENKSVWDSGTVKGGSVSGIAYAGEKLETGREYSWKVISTNNYGEEAESESAFFLTGIMEGGFRNAKWIEADQIRKEIKDSTRADLVFSGQLTSREYPEKELNPAVYMRKDFSADGPVKRAVIFAAAHGVYDLQLDGMSVGDILAPEYTSYRKHLEYQTYDVTELLEEGEHALGCILADGWYTGKIGLLGVGNQYGDKNAFLACLEIEYEDGRKESIGTDESFKWAEGGYIYADLFVGEYFDSRKHPAGFSRAGFDDSEWKNVKTEDYGFDNLTGQSISPVCVLREIKPEVIVTPKGELVLDAGENIAGCTVFDVVAAEGTEIGLEHSEVLDKDGNFLQNIMGQNKNQKDRFICSEGRNSYRPKFTYHGFRYVKVTGLDEIDPADFRILVLGSGLERTGYFETSDPDLNKLQENIYRSQEGNMLIIPTDCPQRERAGWTGDMQVYAPTAAFNMDVKAFLKRWLYDMRLEQLPDGQIPHVIPHIDSNKYIDNSDGKHISSSGWADACVIVPYRLYKAYGDISLLKDNYQMMLAWMDYIKSTADENGIWGKEEFHFGDWLLPSIIAEYGDPAETSKQTKTEVATAMYAYVSSLMAEIAGILDDSAGKEEFENINAKIKRAFSDEFVHEDGTMNKPLQGLYVMALAMDLVDEKKKPLCIDNLVKLIHENGDHLDTGFLSVPFLLDTLYENGHKELAYKLLMNKSAPSWLYEVKMGATTIWENWLAILPDGTRTNSSYNHFAFGCVGDFMYRRIGGLNAEEAGFKKVRIEPDFDFGPDRTETVFDSVYGKIRIFREKKKDGKTVLEVELPPNTSGILKVPGDEIPLENGRYSFTV